MSPTLAPETPPLRSEPDGTIRVGPSRITLDILVETYRAGATAADLAGRFTTLTLADIHGALAYVHSHPVEVDEYLTRREAEAGAVEEMILANQRPFPTREELLARKAARDTVLGAAAS